MASVPLLGPFFLYSHPKFCAVQRFEVPHVAVMRVTGFNCHSSCVTASLRAHTELVGHVLVKVFLARLSHPYPQVPQNIGCAYTSKHQKRPTTLIKNVFLTSQPAHKHFSSTLHTVTSGLCPWFDARHFTPSLGRAWVGQTQRQGGSVATMGSPVMQLK